MIRCQPCFHVPELPDKVNSVMAGLLSAVAAVSLLVGGIGIMNIMLANLVGHILKITDYNPLLASSAFFY